eukprot:UN03088
MKPESKVNQVLHKFKSQTFLSSSQQLPWALREDGRLTPPSVHSLEKANQTLTMYQRSLYSHVLTHAQIIEAPLFQRLSQFATPPGIIAEYNFLPNIKTIAPIALDDADADDDGMDVAFAVSDR